MTDEQGSEEGAEEAIEDLEAPAAVWNDVVGGIACQLPTSGCSNPSCTGQTWCTPGTHQGCSPGPPHPTCEMTMVAVQ